MTEIGNYSEFRVNPPAMIRCSFEATRYNKRMNAVTVEQESSIFERLVMSPASAQAMLSIHFSPADEQRMRELMEKNNRGTITPTEQSEMEAFRRIGSFLAIVHAKARLQLKSSNGDGNSTA